MVASQLNACCATVRSLCENGNAVRSLRENGNEFIAEASANPLLNLPFNSFKGRVPSGGSESEIIFKPNGNRMFSKWHN